MGTDPRTLWYLSRGTGIVSLALLTLVLVLGIANTRRGTATRRASRGRAARLVVSGTHRNASLIAVAFVAVHVATSVLDRYAGISWSDVVVPLAAAYRPVWLGLGAVALDLLLAVAVTSLVRVRLGLRVWRAVHWTAYACWPVALVHALGTGSDVHSGVMPAVAAGSSALVGLALTWRLATARTSPGRRLTAAAAALTLTLMGALWLSDGPMRHGWAARAGTPAGLLGGAR